MLVTLLGISAGPRARTRCVRSSLSSSARSRSATPPGYSADGSKRRYTQLTPGPDANSWLGRQLADLSPRRAALAGVLTHKPGLFYLAALTAITNSTSSNANRILQVALYNAIWFNMPIAALTLAKRRPIELQNFLRRATAWVWRRQREIMITAFGILGVYLIVRGVMELRP